MDIAFQLRRALGMDDTLVGIEQEYSGVYGLTLMSFTCVLDIAVKRSEMTCSVAMGSKLSLGARSSRLAPSYVSLGCRD